MILIMLDNANALLQQRERRHCQIAIACSRNNDFWWQLGRVRWYVSTVPEPYRKEHNPATAVPDESKPGLRQPLAVHQRLPQMLPSSELTACLQ